MWFFFFAGAAALALYLVTRPMTETSGSVPGSIISLPGSLISLANAIKAFEGWYPGSRSLRNNNPGNLKFTAWTKGQGATGADDKGFAIFPDYAAGWWALLALLVLRVRQHPEWSILDLFFSYAPPSENDTQKYAAFVAKHVGGDVRKSVV